MAATLELLWRLRDAGVEFIIIGGVAAIAYGSAVKGRTEEMNFGGVLYRVVNLDTLIAANREKDQLAIRHLEAIQKMRREQPGLFEPPQGG